MIKIVINKNLILVYYMPDPIWETVSKLKSVSSGRAITFSPSPSLIHLTKSRNMFLGICFLLPDGIHLNPDPPTLQTIRLATSHVRSAHNTSAGITDLVASKKLDFLALTRLGLAFVTQPLLFLISSHLTIPCIANHVSMDVEVVLAFWYPLHLK